MYLYPGYDHLSARDLSYYARERVSLYVMSAAVASKAVVLREQVCMRIRCDLMVVDC